MIKKIIAIIGILVVLLIASIVVLPIIFKDDIIQLVKQEANNNVNAQIDFGDFDLSLLSSFPDFSFAISDVSVIGIDTFQGDTLIYIGDLLLTVDVMSVIGGEQISIKTIAIDELVLNAIVLKDGTANYDIAKDSSEDVEVEEVEEPKDTSATAFKLSLKNFSIANTNIVYDDQQGGMYAKVVDFNLVLQGDFTEDFTAILIATTIGELTVEMDNIKYLNKAELELVVELDADLANAKYTFKENEFRINQLVLGWDGWVSMPGDDIDLDITFGAKQTEFKNILSLIPAVYAKDFESVKTSGKLALDGYAKGTYSDPSLPAFGLTLKIDDARFQYPDLPKSVENINIKVDVNNPGGSEDNTVIDVSKFHLELAGNPIDMHLVLKTPISDPQIDCGLEGKIDLDKLKDVIPQEEGEELSGLIDMNIVINGRLSTIEEERYEEFNALGNLNITNMKYKSADLPQGAIIETLNLEFSPQYVDLVKFDVTVGKSDFHMDGKIENFIAYALTDSAVIMGSYNLSSTLLDANEFMTEEEAEAVESAEEGDSIPMTVFEVPGTVDFQLSSRFDKILYDNMTMTDVNGLLIIKDEAVTMKDLQISMLKGMVTVNGTYETTNPKSPTVDFDLGVEDFDIPLTFETFNTVKKLAPITENCIGKFSTNLKFVAVLDEQMEPDMNTLTGGGTFTTDEVRIEGSETIDKLADLLNNDKYKSLKIEDVNASYEFRDGRLYVDPFEVKVEQSTATIYGSNGFDETLDYTMDMKVPTSELGSDVNAFVGDLVSMANSSGAKFEMPDNIEVQVKITGTCSDPKVSLGKLNALGGDKSVKEQVAEKIDEAVEEVKEMVNEEIDKAKEQAEKEAKAAAEKLIKDAEREAAKLIKEAAVLAGITKKEGYANANETENAASNPFQKVAAKVAADVIRKETDKQVDKILKQADKQAKAIVDKAKINASKKK
ncbi:MAG: hypothetical protein COB85_05080 [Bacteroidetes bacterium]|nr:MAG: hypothetical protein COB85_05080 [Bacteroidota bacterium]